HRPRGAEAGRLHRRGNRAARSHDAALARLLTPRPRPMSAHPLAGEFSVEASAARIRHYRYAEERLMRILGGWIALTPELPVKLLFGRHVWECAQHADAWGRRLPELRAPAHEAEPSSPAFVEFMT